MQAHRAHTALRPPLWEGARGRTVLPTSAVLPYRLVVANVPDDSTPPHRLPAGQDGPRTRSATEARDEAAELTAAIEPAEAIEPSESAELVETAEPTEPDESAESAKSDDESLSDPDSELFAQFEVIRRVLEAHKVAEDDADPEPAPEPASSSGSAERTVPLAGGAPSEPEPTAPLPDQPDLPEPPRRHKARTSLIAIAAALCVFVAGGGLTVLYYDHRHTAAATSTDPAATAPPTPQTLASVAWVLGAVGPSQAVACDVTVCALLRSRGFAGSSLITVQAGIVDVEQANVVLLTPLLRRQLGSSVDPLLPAEPLAVFGSGSNRVEVTAVALTGPAAYARSLAADRDSRRSVGNALLTNQQLTFGPQARALLAAGLVDTRVCAFLATLAGTDDVVIAGFTTRAPGAGPDMPTTGVLIASVNGQPATGSAPAAAQLHAAAQAQQGPYSVMSVTTVEAGGAQALQVLYSQPGPLDLLATPSG